MIEARPQSYIMMKKAIKIITVIIAFVLAMGQCVLSAPDSCLRPIAADIATFVHVTDMTWRGEYKHVAQPSLSIEHLFTTKGISLNRYLLEDIEDIYIAAISCNTLLLKFLYRDLMILRLSWEGRSEDEIISRVRTMTVAGQHATSQTIQNALNQLADIVKDEILKAETVMQGKEAPFLLEDLQRLKDFLVPKNTAKATGAELIIVLGNSYIEQTIDDIIAACKQAPGRIIVISGGIKKGTAFVENIKNSKYSQYFNDISLDNMSEASSIKLILQHVLPEALTEEQMPQDIWLEEESDDTMKNIVNVRRLLYEKKFFINKEVLLISATIRGEATFRRFFGDNIRCINWCLLRGLDFTNIQGQDSEHISRLVLNEMAKLPVYAAKGHIAPVNITPDVQNAWLRLLARRTNTGHIARKSSLLHEKVTELANAHATEEIWQEKLCAVYEICAELKDRSLPVLTAALIRGSGRELDMETYGRVLKRLINEANEGSYIQRAAYDALMQDYFRRTTEDPYKDAKRQFKDTVALMKKIGEPIGSQIVKRLSTPEVVEKFDIAAPATEAYRVVWNTALGPAAGGVREREDANRNMDYALAWWMTWKCALSLQSEKAKEYRKKFVEIAERTEYS